MQPNSRHECSNHGPVPDPADLTSATASLITTPTLKSARNILALLLTVLWLPATSHCLLESAGFIQTDDCCAATESSCDKGDTCGDECQSLESASYKASDAPQLLGSPELLVTVLLPTATTEQSVPHYGPSLAADRVICLAVGWQFSSRAAIPVRAPSLAS